MENDIIYDIWLQSCFGTNNSRFISAIELFGSPRDIYQRSAKEYEGCGLFTEREIQKLNNKSLKYAQETAERCDILGIMAVSYCDLLYPERLKKIAGPPVMLYVKGRIPDDDLPFVSIFGTRYPSDGSGAIARSFARGLADNGVVVVSGGAIGIDQFAHKGALETGGKTICVAGCGLDVFSEGGRNEVISEVIRQGTVVSEYPPKYPATKYTFPMRDRIISGLSDCSVIVQSGTGSGSLIAAKYAIKQGRKLFVVPGPAYSERYLGNNLLLKAGFSAVLDHEDVLSWFDNTMLISEKEPNPPLTQELERQLSIKPEAVSPRIKTGAVFSDPPGYRMSIELKNNISSLLSSQNAGDMPERHSDKPNEGNKLFARDVSAGPMTEQYNKTRTPFVTEKMPEPDEFLTERKYAVPERNTPAPERIIEEEADTKENRVISEPEIMNEPLTEKAFSGFQGSMDFASKEYKDFLLDEVKYKQGGKESPYITLDKDIFESLFLPQKEAFDKISELLGDSNLKVDEVIPKKQKSEKPSAKTTRQKKSKQSDKNDDTPKPEKQKKKEKRSVQKEQKITSTNRAEQEKTIQKPAEIEKNKEILSERLTEDAISVYDTFSDTSLSTDEIILAAGLPTGRVFVAITELCSAGYIRSVPGSKYIKTK